MVRPWIWPTETKKSHERSLGQGNLDNVTIRVHISNKDRWCWYIFTYMLHPSLKNVTHSHPLINIPYRLEFRFNPTISQLHGLWITLLLHQKLHHGELAPVENGWSLDRGGALWNETALESSFSHTMVVDCIGNFWSKNVCQARGKQKWFVAEVFWHSNDNKRNIKKKSQKNMRDSWHSFQKLVESVRMSSFCWNRNAPPKQHARCVEPKHNLQGFPVA